MCPLDPSLPTDEWISSASTLIRQKARPRAEDSALETACLPGLALLNILEEEGLHSTGLLDLLQTS